VKKGDEERIKKDVRKIEKKTADMKSGLKVREMKADKMEETTFH